MNRTSSPGVYSGQLNVAFLSDWHCGSGAGRHAGIDREIALKDGLPYVPGRTLKGLWRDACERVAFALDNGKENGQWAALVRELFGSPSLALSNNGDSRGLLHVSPAVLTSAWRDRLTQNDGDVARLLKSGLRVSRRNVTIDDETGAAKRNHLRLIEFARAGLDLSAEYSIDTAQRWEIDLLLSVGLNELTHIGSYRRRGSGRCTVTDSHTFAPVEDILREHLDDVQHFNVPVDLRSSKGLTLHASPNSSEGMLRRAGTLRITLTQPVLATKAVLGNLLVSHDFIPGSVVLPLVAKAIGADAPQLIRNQRIIVTDAVPAVDGHRMAKTPRSLLSSEKGTGWHRNSTDVRDARISSPEPADRAISGWGWFSEDRTWSIHHQELVVSAHASINDAAQRTLDNGVYSLQAIPAHTVLDAEVWLPESTSERFGESLPSKARLGRYRDSEFGGVTIEWIEAEDSADSVHRGVTDVKNNEEFSIWLTSDASLVDRNSLVDCSPERVATDIAAKLKILGYSEELEVVREKTFVSMGRRDSWTASHSLPRPTIPVMSAGSVITFKATQAIPASVLSDVLNQSIGVRKSEGFGRIQFLPQERSWKATSAQSTDHAQPVGHAQSHNQTDVSPEPDAWSTVYRDIWRAEIQARIRTTAFDKNKRIQVLPIKKGELAVSDNDERSKSELGTLRTAALELASDQRAIDRWLDSKDSMDSDEIGKVRRFSSDGLSNATDFEKWLRGWTGSDESPALPMELAGLAVPEVASWVLVECIRYQTRGMQTGNKYNDRTEGK